VARTKELKPLEKISLASKVVRALGKAGGVRLSMRSRKNPAGVSAHYVSNGAHRELTNALLEAEEAKAEGIMAYERRNLPH
jgi:hypothetical protein